MRSGRDADRDLLLRLRASGQVVSERPLARRRALGAAAQPTGLEIQCERILLAMAQEGELPEQWRSEMRFDPDGRQWRFDFAIPDLRIAVECEGGVWVEGRHNRPQGFEDDCEKYNRAAILNWTVLRFTDRMLSDGTARETIAAAAVAARAR